MKQLWVLLLLLPIALATTIETSETTIEMEDNTANIIQKIILKAEQPSNVTFITTPQLKNIEITIDNKKKTCLQQAEFLRCNIPKGNHNLTINYETSHPIAISGENTIIRYTDRLPYITEKQKVTLKLPIGYIIPREKDKEESFYISPATKDVYSDGQRIILNWEQKGQDLPISVISRKVIGQPIGWIIATIISLLITTILSVTYTLRKPAIKVVKQKPKKQIVPTLIDNEQKVVNFLKENGEVWQKQIQQATQFSKAKVSRVVKNLEARGVIVKTPYGNTNKIMLKK